MLAVKKGSTQQSLIQAVAMSQLESQAMLVSLPKRYYQLQRLHVSDSNFRNGYSGINATMFGGTSPLGSTFGGLITRMGSTVIYPYRTNTALWDNRFKELKPTADLGYKTYSLFSFYRPLWMSINLGSDSRRLDIARGAFLIGK